MRKTLIVALALAMVGLIILLYGFNTPQQTTVKSIGPVAFLVQDDTGAFVLQVKQGAQKAASEAGGELSIETITEERLEAAADQWAARKAEAALLYLTNAALLEKARTAFEARGIPVATIMDGDALAVKTDEKSIAALLCGYARAYCPVYVQSGDPQRLTTFLRAMPEGASILTEGLPKAGEENACVVALTGEDTLRLSALKERGVFDAALFGVDPGEARANVMETGGVDALVLSTPYAMGYAAVNAALQGRKEPLLLPAKAVAKEDMYKAENIKVMFPLLN